MGDAETSDLTRTAEALGYLLAIGRGWPRVLDPIRVERGGSSVSSTPRAKTEDERDEQLLPDARADTPRVLAFWVRETCRAWPAVLQTLQPAGEGKVELVTTEVVDCTDMGEMLGFLVKHVDRIATWTEGEGRDYGRTFVCDLERLAAAVSRVAYPPKGDRMTIGACPACGSRLTVKAPPWRRPTVRVPQPTTDPAEYPSWIQWLPPGTKWEPERARPIVCRCGKSHTLQEWRALLQGPSLPLTAAELVLDIRQHFGRKLSPITIRKWSRDGLFPPVGHSSKGHLTYDRTQVLAALTARDSQRVS